jgi:ADP-heptose:LPS heptosyltransferase
MAGVLKKYFPECRIIFLGRTYTKDVVSLSEHVTEFINYDEIENLPISERVEAIKKINAHVFVNVFPKKEIAYLAKKAGILYRVGTTNRIYHWFTCNKLIKLSRKKSKLHESQLNLKLLHFFKINIKVNLTEIPQFYGFTHLPTIPNDFKNLVDKNKFNLILHPKSKGSAREWGIDNFERLIELLPKDKFKIFVSGTLQEGNLMPELLKNKFVTDLTGKLTLSQFIAFINLCDGLVAASTGPLHIAAALNKKAIGLFIPKRPMHPGRWSPVGKNAHYIVYDKNCVNCNKGIECNCISKINPQQIIDLLKL